MRKRSVALAGHRTSVSLEQEFWDALDAIARDERRSLASLIAEIDRLRLTQTPAPGLASALRVFALRRLTKAGASGAGDEA
jgi:predicted DNA-binding ribbon-helix-helix protein